MGAGTVDLTDDRPIPYGPTMTRLLPCLHRAFLAFNRSFAAPALRVGLGPLFVSPVSGSLLLLRTRGRRTGVLREAPLGYVLHDGAVYVCAGFGRRTAWLANLAAEPTVEIVLPGARLQGIAAEVVDRTEFEAVFPKLIRSMGTVGRATVPEAVSSGDDGVAAWFGPCPLVRIRPTAVLPGLWDPSGRGWMVLGAVEVLLAGLALAAARRR